jgi:WD40 repeat protein
VEADQGTGVMPGTAVLRVRDLATGECVRVLEPGGAGIYHVQVSSDGRTAVTASPVDRTIWIYDLATGECLRTLGVGPWTMTLTTDARYALLAWPTSIGVCDLATGARLAHSDLPADSDVRQVFWTGDGRYALATDQSGTRVWEVDWDVALREP